ncbi:MAG TPA: ABC transporter substrate-binding protein [Propionibacterium sp.]|nr:ABC transporter substrate-binding protein [Propionibacterium sp.]
MNHTARRVLALVALLTLVLTGCARTAPPGSQDDGPATATIGLTYIPDIQFAPFYVAAEEGIFTEQGLDATLRHHGAQEGLFTALVAGQEQYVIAGGDELVQARAQGMDLVAIAQYYHRYPVVLIVPDTSPAQSVADLAGMRIGLPGKFGESWFGLQAALDGAGLAESDVEVVEIGYTAHAALTTGKVDAVVGFANNDQVQFELAGVPTRTVPLAADGDVPLVSIVLATTTDHLASNPETSAKVARAMVAGMERVVAEPASAVAAGKEHIPTLDEAGAEASALATLEATIPLWTAQQGRATGTMDEQEWRAMTDFMLEAGLVTTEVDPAEAMTNEHVTG